MNRAKRIEWLPALMAVMSLIAIQCLHFAVTDAAHADEAVGHTHESLAAEDGVPTDGQIDDTHCVSHGACHLLLHALASGAPYGPGLEFDRKQKLSRATDPTFGRSVKPPTPPPLI